METIKKIGWTSFASLSLKFVTQAVFTTKLLEHALNSTIINGSPFYRLSTLLVLLPPPPPPRELAWAACAAKMRSWAGTRSPSSSISYSTSTRALFERAAGAFEEAALLPGLVVDSKASLRFLESRRKWKWGKCSETVSESE